MQTTEITIEAVSDFEFEIDLIGEEVEVLPWRWSPRNVRPFDHAIDGVTAPSNQGVDHVQESRIDAAFAGRYHDYGVGSVGASAAA